MLRIYQKKSTENIQIYLSNISVMIAKSTEGPLCCPLTGWSLFDKRGILNFPNFSKYNCSFGFEQRTKSLSILVAKFRVVSFSKVFYNNFRIFLELCPSYQCLKSGKS
jgi:hypothetical protein